MGFKDKIAVVTGGSHGIEGIEECSYEEFLS